MNRLKHFLLAVVSAAVISMSSTSCESCVEGQGASIIEDREVASFNQLEVDLSANITLTQGEDRFVRIEAQENLLRHISTNVSGKTMVIEAKPCVYTDEPLNISITVPNLTSIDLNGSGTIKINGQLNTEDFEVDINGSGTFDGEIFANSIEADLNGSGEINVTGSVKKLEVEINGSGRFQGFSLQAFEADVVIRGSGDAEVNALNSLDANISGSGDIHYTGNPDISTSISGSGEVSKKD